MRRIIAAIGLMLLAPVALAQTTRTYSYDVLGRLTKVTPGTGTPVCYAYDPADNRTNVSAAAACTAGGPGGGQNFPPVAIGDYVVALAFSSFWAGPLDVLLNDTDPNLPSDTLTVTSVTGSPYASIAAGGGDVIFAGPPGIYNLNYTIKDSQNATSSATVTLELVYCEFGC